MSPLIAGTNARLTKLEGGGTSEDYDQPAGADATRWSGDAEAYVQENFLEQAGPNGLDLLTQTVLTVPASLGVVPASDDMATYTYKGGVQVRRVRNVEDRSLTLGTYKLRLWDA